VRQIVEEGPGNTPEAYEQYLQCVDRVRESVAVLERLLARDRGVLEGALGTLEAQFRQLLKSSRYCFLCAHQYRDGTLSNTRPATVHCHCALGFNLLRAQSWHLLKQQELTHLLLFPPSLRFAAYRPDPEELKAAHALPTQPLTISGRQRSCGGRHRPAPRDCAAPGRWREGQHVQQAVQVCLSLSCDFCAWMQCSSLLCALVPGYNTALNNTSLFHLICVNPHVLQGVPGRSAAANFDAMQVLRLGSGRCTRWHGRTSSAACKSGTSTCTSG